MMSNKDKLVELKYVEVFDDKKNGIAKVLFSTGNIVFDEYVGNSKEDRWRLLDNEFWIKYDYHAGIFLDNFNPIYFECQGGQVILDFYLENLLETDGFVSEFKNILQKEKVLLNKEDNSNYRFLPHTEELIYEIMNFHKDHMIDYYLERGEFDKVLELQEYKIK